MFYPDVGELDIQFFCNQCGERCVYALTHFGTWRDDRDSLLVDPDIRRQCRFAVLEVCEQRIVVGCLVAPVTNGKSASNSDRANK